MLFAHEDREDPTPQMGDRSPCDREVR